MRIWPFKSEPAAPPSNPAVEPAASDRFRDIAEVLPEPLMVVQAGAAVAERRIVFANAAARDTFRLIGDAPLLVTAIRRPEVLHVVEDSLVGRLPGEATFEHQDRSLRALARPFVGEGGEQEAVLLIQDETAARGADRMRADFLANASHELRTPLASMAGFIETLRGHAKDDPAARTKFLEIMAAQADRMGRLIEDLMSLSRIELNEHVPPQGLVDVEQVVADVVDALVPIARKAGAEVRVNIRTNAPSRVTGDRDQIVQVVQNLIDNALKYSPEGAEIGVELSTLATSQVAAEPRDPQSVSLTLLHPDHEAGAAYVAVRVTDHGPGIAREHLPRLSERFYRAPGQKSGEKLGTGLGLAIVKHIVNRHRGGLAVESAPDRGSSFTAYFPVAAAT